MEEEVLGKAYDGRLMRRLVRYLRPYRGTVVISLVFLLAQSMAQVIGPLLTELAIDRYLVHPEHPQIPLFHVRWTTGSPPTSGPDSRRSRRSISPRF